MKLYLCAEYAASRTRLCRQYLACLGTRRFSDGQRGWLRDESSDGFRGLYRFVDPRGPFRGSLTQSKTRHFLRDLICIDFLST